MESIQNKTCIKFIQINPTERFHDHYVMFSSSGSKRYTLTCSFLLLIALITATVCVCVCVCVYKCLCSSTQYAISNWKQEMIFTAIQYNSYFREGIKCFLKISTGFGTQRMLKSNSIDDKMDLSWRIFGYDDDEIVHQNRRYLAALVPSITSMGNGVLFHNFFIVKILPPQRTVIFLNTLTTCHSQNHYRTMCSTLMKILNGVF